ncbi:cell division protein ZapA [Qipengyuania sp. ASV99]|uniref:cell division protein ZapA n=1 Tax=Qipengyuania sp. ASV99 TaxID=3399681 RepID=UPI003A4C73F2
MSKVRIKVGPMNYSIACGPGEEEQVSRLGALIDEHYARLGDARAPLEAQNVVFAALFMADELAEARTAANQARAELTEARQELQHAKDDAANALRKAISQTDEHLEKAGGKKAELLAEIETLRKAEERARKDNAALKAEVAELQDRARHQHDLFGGPAEDAALSLALAEKLEALAVRVEAAASGIEAQ